MRSLSKRLLALSVLMSVTMGLVAGCGGPKAPAESGASTKEPEQQKIEANAPISLKFGHVNSEQTSYHKGILKFKEEVEKNSNGRIKVEVFANSLLGNERDLIEGMQLGTVDCAFVATAPLGSFVPEMAILDAPFLYRDSNHAFKVADGNVGQILAQKAKEKLGITVMGYMNVGFRHIFSTKPVRTIEDLRGLKIRLMENKLHLATFQKLGAMPTPMAYGEVFTALQQRTIDAAENAIQNVLNQRFYEVTKHVTKTGHFYCLCAIGISGKTLEKIPDELKPLIMEAGKVACQYQRKLSEEDNINAEAELKKLGVTFYEIDRQKLAEMCAAVYQEFKDILPPELVAKVKNE